LYISIYKYMYIASRLNIFLWAKLFTHDRTKSKSELVIEIIHILMENVYKKYLLTFLFIYINIDKS